MQIGQRVQINGTNTARKKAEGIPIGVPAELYNYSKAPGKTTVYNVMTSNGEKYALALKEFKMLEPILKGKDDENPIKVEGSEEDGEGGDGVSSKKNDGNGDGE